MFYLLNLKPQSWVFQTDGLIFTFSSDLIFRFFTFFRSIFPGSSRCITSYEQLEAYTNIVYKHNTLVAGLEVSSFEHPGFATCLETHPVNPHYFLVGCNNCILCWDKRCTTKLVKKYVYKDTFGQVNILLNTIIKFLIFFFL